MWDKEDRKNHQIPKYNLKDQAQPRTRPQSGSKAHSILSEQEEPAKDGAFIHHPRAKNRPSGRSRVISESLLSCRTRDEAETSQSVLERLWKQKFSHHCSIDAFGSRRREGRAHELVAQVFCFRSDTHASLVLMLFFRSPRKEERAPSDIYP